jgi:AcrR family transcriptional regulator
MVSARYPLGVTTARAPRSERRTRTRERLVDAAFEVFAERGFHAASVDEVADAAGFSIGALYSNFAGKEDLFLAVFDRHLQWAERTLGATEPPAGLPDDWARQFLVFAEFWAYAVRDERARERLAPRMAEIRAACAALLERLAAARGKPLARPPEQLAVVAMAVLRGLAIERLADPSAVDAGLEGEVLERLLFG